MKSSTATSQGGDTHSTDKQARESQFILFGCVDIKLVGR